MQLEKYKLCCYTLYIGQIAYLHLKCFFYIPGFGKPPESGIISAGALASTLVNSRIRDGCLEYNFIICASFSIIIYIGVTYLLADILEKKRPQFAIATMIRYIVVLGIHLKLFLLDFRRVTYYDIVLLPCQYMLVMYTYFVYIPTPHLCQYIMYNVHR